MTGEFSFYSSYISYFLNFPLETTNVFFFLIGYFPSYDSSNEILSGLIKCLSESRGKPKNLSKFHNFHVLSSQFLFSK